VVRAWRWRLLLAVQGIIVPRMRIWTLTLIGLFFHFVIPGGSGGEVVRTFYLIREVQGRKRGVVLSVLMDLILNLFGVVILAAACVAWKWDWLTATVSTHRYVVLSLVVSGLTGVVSGWYPASRAAKLDPVVALRAE